MVGASGYAGGELLRILLDHPAFEISAVVASESSAGRLLGDVHPQLPALADHRLAGPGAVADLAVDIAFLSLPHGESATLARALPEEVRVVDLGADHRLRDPQDWQRAYGGTHAGTWPYGLPELPGARAEIAHSTRVAAPGCYPTATILALRPLLDAGLVEPVDLVVVAASGTSGAGRSAKLGLLGSEVMGDLTAYKVATHQHVPEMLQALGHGCTLSFTPVLAPMPRGILATATARLRPGVGTDDLYDALQAAYAGEPFMHVRPPGRWPHTAAVSGSNGCQLQVAADRAAGRAVVVAAIDNLGKGAAGQALQCANLMLGLPESAGLTANGVAP